MCDESPTEALIRRLGGGDSAAAEELFPRIYDELRGLAGKQMAHQRGAHTLQATALVNEVYLRLAGARSGCTDRAHFLRLAARAMRQVLVDHARRKAADMRQLPPAEDPLQIWSEEYERRSGGLLALDIALERLAERDEELARLVELRFFGGASMIQVASILGLSERSASRKWETARLILLQELGT